MPRRLRNLSELGELLERTAKAPPYRPGCGNCHWQQAPCGYPAPRAPRRVAGYCEHYYSVAAERPPQPK